MRPWTSCQDSVTLPKCMVPKPCSTGLTWSRSPMETPPLVITTSAPLATALENALSTSSMRSPMMPMSCDGGMYARMRGRAGKGSAFGGENRKRKGYWAMHSWLLSSQGKLHQEVWNHPVWVRSGLGCPDVTTKMANKRPQRNTRDRKRCCWGQLADASSHRRRTSTAPPASSQRAHSMTRFESRTCPTRREGALGSTTSSPVLMTTHRGRPCTATCVTPTIASKPISAGPSFVPADRTRSPCDRHAATRLHVCLPGAGETLCSPQYRDKHATTCPTRGRSTCSQADIIKCIHRPVRFARSRDVVLRHLAHVRSSRSHVQPRLSLRSNSHPEEVPWRAPAVCLARVLHHDHRVGPGRQRSPGRDVCDLPTLRSRDAPCQLCGNDALQAYPCGGAVSTSQCGRIISSPVCKGTLIPAGCAGPALHSATTGYSPGPSDDTTA